MIVHARRGFVLLRTLPSSFWLVGDLNARYRPAQGYKNQPPTPVVGTTPPLEETLPPAVPHDSPVKTP
jgi:hypothetical protein